MAFCRIILLCFVLEILPFCFCSDPYCAFESENQYDSYGYRYSWSSEDDWDSTYEANYTYGLNYEPEPIVCPPDADTCVPFTSSIEQCQKNSSSSPGFYCYCDSACKQFDDCCYNLDGHNENGSSQAVETKLNPERRYWSCTPFTIGTESNTACIRDVFVVNRCPSGTSEDPALVRRCESPAANDTVFFDSRGIFYRNRYCALCHGVNSTDLIPYIIFKPCLDSKQEFCGQRPILVNGSGPPPIRWCVEDHAIISHCDPQTEGDVQSPCLNETARVMINGSVYKNIDCATCNGVSFDNTSISSSDCEITAIGQVIVSPYSAFDISYYYPELQCTNGLRLSGTECVPEAGSWPDCTSGYFLFADMTNGSLQCFDGFEILKIQAYMKSPNASVYEFKSEYRDGNKETFMVFPANILPDKTQIEDFVERKLNGTFSKCCRDNKIFITESCYIENELSAVNESELSFLIDDVESFEPVVINGTAYVMYNRTTFVKPVEWYNDTEYKRLSRHWIFSTERTFTLYGQIVDIDTCAYTVVPSSLITENEIDNVTYLIYQDIWFPPERYVRFKNGSVRLCWTAPDPPEPMSMFGYSRGQYILSLILFALSSICLLATLCTYCILKPLRNLQGISIMNFVSALLVAQVLLHFIAPHMISVPTMCTTAAVVTHYFLLAAFTWTNILAWDLVRHFASSSFLPKRHSEKRRLITYLGIGWGLPLIIVILCLVVQLQNPSLFRYGKIGKSCWIYQVRCIVLAFLVPVAVSFLTNMVLFSLTAWGVHKSKRDSTVLHDSNQEQRKEIFKELVVHFKISCLLGFGWSFGFIAAFSQAVAVWTIFIITSSLQGIFIFIFFGANQRVRGLWRKRIRESKKSRENSSSKTRTHTTGTTKTNLGSMGDRHRHKLLKEHEEGSSKSDTQTKV